MFFPRITHISLLGTLVLLSGVFLSGVRPENDRLKRSTNSVCKDKFKVIPEHSICLTKSKDASNSGVSSQDKTEIVNFHNKLRAIPDATNMLKLEWDDEIATIAQHWADSCNIRHDSGARRSIPGIYSLGQNLAMNAGNWNISIQLWYDEVNIFNYGGQNVLEEVGHYTQLVWADTHRIGCGYADCPGTKYYVCNYGPGGNSGDNSKPYKSGTKGSDCGANFRGDLCECPSPCLNGGTLHRNNCTCTCKAHDFYTASDHCSLNCSNVEKDPSYCSQDYGKQDCMLIYLDCPNKCKICPLSCKKASSDPDYCSKDFGKIQCSIIETDCPNKCHVCPYSDPTYVEGSVPIVKRTDESAGTTIRCDVITVITMATISVIKFL